MKQEDTARLLRLAERAACRAAVKAGKAKTSWWFPADERSTGNAARRICESCEMRRECLEWALLWDEHGIWGGLSREQRKQTPLTVPCTVCGETIQVIHRAYGPRRYVCSESCAAKRAKLRHGRRATYLAGCRCDACRDAERRYKNAYLARRRLEPA